MNPHQKWWGFFMPACEIIMHADHLFVFNWHVPNRIDLETHQVIHSTTTFATAPDQYVFYLAKKFIRL